VISASNDPHTGTFTDRSVGCWPATAQGSFSRSPHDSGSGSDSGGQVTLQPEQ
jgi:hypothetical protein